MKFTIAKSLILDALGKLQSVTESRSTLPILGNVHIAAKKDGTEGSLVLTVTNLDIYTRVKIACSVEESGATTLPVRRVFACLKAAVGTEVNVMVTDKNVASIACGNSLFKLSGLPGDEFPNWPGTTYSQTVTLPQATLGDLLKRTVFAVSNDETRYILNGVMLSFKGDEILAVGTDGRRLAMLPAAGITLTGKEVALIVPTKVVVELSRLLGRTGDVTLSISENWLHAAVGEAEITGKLIEGEYPNYKQVIPTESKERIAIGREVFIGGLRRASLLSSDKSESVKLQFTKDLLTITASTPDVGEARESLPIQFKGKEITIAFNPGYLLDALQAQATDDVFLELTDELSPGMIKTADQFVCVIMPVRLR
jgi:DNA polymerase-3 subunit beta